MFVVTGQGVLVADGQGSVPETKGLVDAIAKVTTQPIKYVVICSDHGDHTAGNAAFPAGVTYIIHPASKAILERAEAARAGRGGGGWKLPADAMLVSDRQSLKLGAETIDILFLGRAHTGGDLSVSLPQQKILFLSETFLNRVFPGDAIGLPDRMAEGAGPRRGDEGRPLHRRPRVHRVGAGLERRTARVSQSDGSGDRGSHAPAQSAGLGRRRGQAGELRPVRDWTLAKSQGPIAIRKVYEELDGQLK